MGFTGHNLFAQPLKIKSDPLFENIVTPEYNFIAGAYLPLSEDKSFGLEPSILTKTTNWSETQVDISARVIYLNNVWAGVSYRTAEQAYAFLFGFEMGDMFIGYAYDTAVQGICYYSGGTHVIALCINLAAFSKFENVRLKSRFKYCRLFLNPFRRDGSRTDRRGSGS